MIYEILRQMMKAAAEEINWPVGDDNVEQILAELHNNYEIIISIDDDGPITWQLMNVVCDCIREWQVNTVGNYM